MTEPTLEQLETELGADLRALAPEPDLEFLGRVTAPRAVRRRRRLPSWLPTLLVTAALLAVVAVPVALLVPSRGTDDPGATGGGAVSSQAAPPEGGAADLDPAEGGPDALQPYAGPTPAAPVPPAGRETLRPQRAVERGAEVELRTRREDLQETADGVVAAAQRLGGYVADARVTTEQDEAEGSSSAAFTLRVPTARLDDLLARLRELADVTALRQSATDITATVVSARDRVRDARDERRALLRALGRAETDAQVEALRRRLRDNRQAIAGAEAALRGSRRRADVATVSVLVAAGEDGAGTWTPGDAAHDAVRVLEVVAGGLLVAGAVLAPLVVLGVPAALVAGALRRRRREAVLRG